MVGQFFLTFNERGRVEWAGEVVAYNEDDDMYVVRLVDWFVGSMTDEERPVRKQDMNGWQLARPSFTPCLARSPARRLASTPATGTRPAADRRPPSELRRRGWRYRQAQLFAPSRATGRVRSPSPRRSVAPAPRSAASGAALRRRPEGETRIGHVAGCGWQPRAGGRSFAHGVPE